MQAPRNAGRLPVAKITGQGLTSIAILVALLWACVIGERVMLGSAQTGAAEALRTMRELRLKNRREPAAAPAETPLRQPRLKVG